MGMFHKISIRWRLTILSAFLLAICCIGLTIVLNLSAFELADSVEAAILTSPATEVLPSIYPEDIPDQLIPLTPSENIQEAKSGFRLQSVLYMLIVVMGGSALTYYVSGKALQPLDILSGQVRNLNVHTLSEPLTVPQSNDEIAELSRAFNDMITTLDNAFMMQKRFSANAAHELRTPLAVLQTKIDVFHKKQSHTVVEYDAIVSVFEKQIRRLRGLVKELLAMTNMEDEKDVHTICLADMFEDMMVELSSIADEKNISLSVHCDESEILGNVDILYRAFYNLIENGIHYNEEGGYVQVDVVKQRNGRINIQVRDSGIGIPDNLKKQIFEPFYRVDTSRSRARGGAGLGLSIVESIITKQGGSITVVDNEKQGTCFEVVL